MDEIILVDNMESDGSVFDLSTTATPRPPTTAGRTTADTGNSNGAAADQMQKQQQKPTMSNKKRDSDGDGIAGVIMMYSPYIPACSVGSRFESRPSIANYYSLIDMEESVKCVVSTALFVTVLISFVLVALLLNPEM